MRRGRKSGRGLAGVLILGVVIMLAVLGGATAVIGYREFTSVLEQQYNNNAYEVAETAKTYLNPDSFATYMETGQTDAEFDRIQAQLDDLVVSTDCNFIYVAVISEDYTTSTYIYDSVNPATGFSRYPFGYTAEDLDEQYTEELRHILTTGQRADRYLYSYTESGAHTTAGAAVLDSSGKAVAVVGVEKSMSILEGARRTYVGHVVLATILFVALTVIGYALILRRSVIHPIQEVTGEAERFADNHEEIGQMKALDNPYEIGVLARSVRKMEIDINSYIDHLTQVTAEKERIGAELSVAAQIQADMLPSIFPAFTDHPEFDIYASMTPAREVGGDFYDFFLIDDTHLAMVMADVSGKGVPAALFMVIAKTLIKNRAQMGAEPAQILSYANEQLCEGNKAELFVTVWLAILDLETGKGIAANAGHEHPALRRAGGAFELVKYRHSPAVAAMEGMRFRQHTFELHRGDSLFVYTDGVTEAVNEKNELFGEKRLLEALNEAPDGKPEKTLARVQDRIRAFTGSAPQFDDITMMELTYYGRKEPVDEIEVEAADENLAAVQGFVDERLEAAGCGMKVQMQIDIAVEEIYVNIAHYAYAPGTGKVRVRYALEEDTAVITFIDRGVPYDPLKKPDPDITLSADERQIGGLGIFMAKKSMDDMSYRYEDGCNILTIRKRVRT